MPWDSDYDTDYGQVSNTVSSCVLSRPSHIQLIFDSCEKGFPNQTSFEMCLQLFLIKQPIMSEYCFEEGVIHQQMKAVVFRERLRNSGYRLRVSAVKTKQGVKKDKPTKVVSNSIKVGSDCSGLGTEIFAMDALGLGHRVVHVFGSEVDPIRRALFQRLHPGCKRVYVSCRIEDRQPANVPTVDLYVAGGDCAAWSPAGLRQGLDDRGGKDGKNRGKLMFDIIAYIETKKPKTFILEQVAGMVKGKFVETFSVILETLMSIKDNGRKVYHVDFKVLNTSETSGIPQNRARLYIVGVQKQLMNAKSFTWPHKVPMIKLSKFFQGNLGTPSLPTSATALRNISSTVDEIIAQGGNVNQMWVIDITPGEKWGVAYQLECTPTLTKTRANSQGFFLLKYMRMTTTDELKRLQGFPVSLPKFPASDSQLRQMLGNAMTLPVLARVVRMVLAVAGFIDTAEVPDILAPMY